MTKIGLIDVDGHNFPSIPLMKISAYHKKLGDKVVWYSGVLTQDLDKVYMSKVFTFTDDFEFPIYAKEVIKGGTGYFYPDGGEPLQGEIEHIYPDYSLYNIKDTAYGFLTRGCPMACPVCIVSKKEGVKSYKVANIDEFWNGQKEIKLLDPNILACKEHKELLMQLIESKAMVDFSQGVDVRLLDDEEIDLLKRIRLKNIHFAWDYMKFSEPVVAGLKRWKKAKPKLPHGSIGTVYVLTNFDTTMEENLHRIYTIRDLGYDPYVMVYEKWKAPREILRLQRWVNAPAIFKKCKRFEDYKG